ncbi:MAG: hypothetical protein IAX21_04430 [Candidatus Bathyarchaeota archaeon]|nr:MAG: hypothetical protein NUK63_01350 [Candidatus Bathyarchaeum tardum]WNZ30104.1 MAG: hypothetical protein IAX21_04430 [Candidatus Bathyarchaeota archaeon]
MFNPGLIEALGQIMIGLKSIGDGLTFVIGFILEYMGISASHQLIQMATILILLSVVWKVGSKVTSSIFLFLIASQALSFLGAS